jgi:hypothetical protein
MGAASVTKTRKRRWLWLRYRKGDVAHNLLVAAERYIHANGGTAVVLGGIKVIQMEPAGCQLTYNLAIGFLGKNLDPPRKEPEQKLRRKGERRR